MTRSVLVAAIALTMLAGPASALALPGLGDAAPAVSVGPVQPAETTQAAALPDLRLATELLDRPRGDPLMQADPAVWIPVLMQTGSAAAAAEAAAEAARLDYGLYPVGDADADGRADVLVEETTYEREEVTYIEFDGEGESEVDGYYYFPASSDLTLVSGSSHAPLWTLEIDEDEYWYPLGDVNGDGVDDIVVETFDGESTGFGESALYAMASVTVGTRTVHFRVVDGATGGDLFELEREFSYSFTFVYAAFVLYALQYDYSYAALVPLGEPGFGVDVVSVQVNDRTVFPGGLFVFAYASVASGVIGIERLDAAGNSQWETKVEDPANVPYPIMLEDLTGDGVPDWVLATDAYSTYAFACVVIQCVSPEDVPSRAVITALDGATGDTAWTYNGLPVFGYSLVAPGGSPDGDGHDLFVTEFTTTPDTSSRIVRLDGANGEVVLDTTQANLAVAIGFSDVTGDGGDEVVLITAEDEEYYDSIVTTVATADLDPIWETNFQEAGLPLIIEYDEEVAASTDFDGDGFSDLVFVRLEEDDFSFEESGLQFRSGATGGELWELDITHDGIVGLALLDDVNLDGGADVALATFDLPEDIDDDERDEIDYADHAGHLELLDGGDGQRIWKRLMHHPDTRPNLTAEWPWVDVRAAGDTNGNGVVDVTYALRSGWGFVEEDDEELEPLRFAMLLEGADSTALLAYPEAFMPTGLGGLSPSAAAPDVELGPAAAAARPTEPAPKPQSGLLPGFEVGLVALAIAGLALARRRR